MSKTWKEVKASITSISEKEKESMEIVAQLIADIIDQRLKMGLSQQELAEKCGVKQSAIARLESMKATPQLDTLSKIVKPLGLKIQLIPVQEQESLHSH